MRVRDKYTVWQRITLICIVLGHRWEQMGSTFRQCLRCGKNEWLEGMVLQEPDDD